jgi:hypothetical protein
MNKEIMIDIEFNLNSTNYMINDLLNNKYNKLTTNIALRLLSKKSKELQAMVLKHHKELTDNN